MTVNLQNRVKAKLFVGFLLTSEVRMHLNQSNLWKKAQILRVEDSSELIEIRFEDHDYIGTYLNDSKIPLNELKNYEKITEEKLRSYCPKLPMNSYKFCLFSQVFIQ